MQTTIADPVASLCQLLPAPWEQRVVLGLVGLPGAGKSTQARRWADAVNARAQAQIMQTVGMDGFHLSRADLAQLPPPHNDLVRRGAPWTFDAAQLRRSLGHLHQPDPSRAPASVLWPDFDHGVGDPVADAIRIEPTTRLVLVEGLYLLLPQVEWNLRSLFHQVWFLNVSYITAMRQLTRRHCDSWGISEAEATARIEANDAINARTVHLTQCFAHALAAPLFLDPSLTLSNGNAL
jgi:pantothenate kinase